MIIKAPTLAAKAHTASIGIIWGAGRNRQHAGASCDNFVVGRGRGGLSGGNCSGDDEGDDEGANDVFHREIPRKLYLVKKISLDNQMR